MRSSFIYRRRRKDSRASHCFLMLNILTHIQKILYSSFLERKIMRGPPYVFPRDMGPYIFLKSMKSNRFEERSIFRPYQLFFQHCGSIIFWYRSGPWSIRPMSENFNLHFFQGHTYIMMIMMIEMMMPIMTIEMMINNQTDNPKENLLNDTFFDCRP